MKPLLVVAAGLVAGACGSSNPDVPVTNECCSMCPGLFPQGPPLLCPHRPNVFLCEPSNWFPVCVSSCPPGYACALTGQISSPELDGCCARTCRLGSAECPAGFTCVAPELSEVAGLGFCRANGQVAIAKCAKDQTGLAPDCIANW